MQGNPEESSREERNVVMELVNNILETSFERFDRSVVDRARYRIIDVVGCAIAGAHAPGCAMMLDLVREWGGKKESTVLVHGGKIPAHNAAMINSIMARSFDFEPVGPFVDGKNIPGHISGTTVPTALAVAEQQGSSGRDLLTALILGDDIASRINGASHFSLDSGWDNTGTANVFAATAIAGKLCGLDEQQILNAFGIALNQAAGSMQNIFDGVHSFKLPQGLASRAGIVSAELAGKGFTGAQDALLGKYGYFSLYCRAHSTDVLTKDLGEKFYADNTFKPYPCCRANHASIDCALELARHEKIRPEEIEAVTVEVPQATYDFAVSQPFTVRQVPQIDAAFSLHYNVANALLRGNVKVEHFAEESVNDPKLRDLIKKVRVTKAPDPQKFLASSIKIKMYHGTEYEKRVEVPRGDNDSAPLTADEKRQKFMDNAAFSKMITLRDAEKILHLLERLEKVDKVAKIARLLVA
jgi:2-methylcitrate dehydratase PrpD